MNFLKLFIPFLFLILILAGNTIIKNDHFINVEICDNGIDDDGDGKIDLNDEDCICAVLEPESLIPNPSFEDMACCPQFRSQLNCAAGWIQASEPTTDYIHECGFQGWPDLPPPRPFPDGEGIVGFRDGRNISGNGDKNWKEYAGACLLGPLLKDNQYTFEFYIGFIDPIVSPPIDIAFFGTGSCEFLPFGIGDSDFGCPTNDSNWKFLSSKRVVGNGWIKTTITITPDFDIYAIAIGPPCAPTNSDASLYYFFDNLILAESKFFDLKIATNGLDCTEDFRLSINDSPDFEYQWYKDGIAIPGATDFEYNGAAGGGLYNVVVTTNGICRLSRDFTYRFPNSFKLVSHTICENESFNFNGRILENPGYYTDTIKRHGYCDSIVTLDLKQVFDSYGTIEAKFFAGESFKMENYSFTEPGIYDLELMSNEGCDSLITLDLSTYKIFIPNIFSPNNDGVNDIFEIYSEEPDIFIKNIQIFSRWGHKVFEADLAGNDIMGSWDGSYLGRTADSGVYTFVLVIILEDGNEKLLSGSISLIK